MTIAQVVTDHKLDDNYTEIWLPDRQQVLTLTPAKAGAFYTAHLFDFEKLAALTLKLAADQDVIVIE